MESAIQQLMGSTHRLVVFDAVVRTTSFTRAAQELGISQPAVSRQIGLLERELRSELFRRQHNRVELTAAGTALHRHVDDAFSALSAGMTELHGTSERLTLAVQPSIADSWFSPRLADLRAALEPSTVVLALYDTDEELTSLDHDVSVRFGSAFGRGWRSDLLVTESVVPVASPEFAERHGLDSSTAATALLDGPPLLQLEPKGRTWLNWVDWFRQCDLEWERPADELLYRSYSMLVQQALSGRGILLGWHTLLGDLVEREMLVPVGPQVERPDVGYHLVWPSGMSRNAGLRNLRPWLASMLHGLG